MKAVWTLILAILCLGRAFGEDPRSLELQRVETLFELMHMDQQLDAGFQAMLPMLDQISADMKLDAESRTRLEEVLTDWFHEDVDRQGIMDHAVRLYVETFTLEELDALIAFYESPVGKKFTDSRPRLMREMTQFSMEETQSRQGELMKRLDEFYEELHREYHRE